MDVYLDLKKDFLKKETKPANDRAIKEWGEDGEDRLYWENMPFSVEELNIEDEELHIAVDSELGYMSFSIPMNDILDDVLTFAVKKMNKIKTALEALK